MKSTKKLRKSKKYKKLRIVDSLDLFTKKNLLFSVLSIVAILLVLFSPYVFSYLKYDYYYLRCGGSPVMATDFAASYTYKLPGQSGYKPTIFDEYYCTEAQAKAAGFHASPLTATGQKEYETNQAKLREEKRFNPSKIDYAVYRANLSGYTSTPFTISTFNGNDKQVFNFIKKNGFLVADVRQGKVGSSYELCTNKKYKCEVIGKDSEGRQVKREYPKVKSKGFSIGIRIGNTFITISRGNSDLTINQAIQLLGSMQKVES